MMKPLLAVLLTASVILQSPASPRRCNQPLGMEEGRKLHVPDTNITASGSRAGRPSHHARLYGLSAWCSVGNITGSWLQVSLGQRYRITEMMTQGSKRDYTWVTRYRVEYRGKGQPWKAYPKELIGNDVINNLAGKTNRLRPVIIAHDMRLHPLAVHGVTSGSEKIDSACLRLELFGCRDYGLCPNPVTVPNGNFSREQRPAGEMISFTCQAEFDLVGSARARCVAGRWDKPAPSCVARCPHPGVPTNGIIEQLSLGHGGKARYRCDIGFSITGLKEITCLRGQWVPGHPFCKANCQPVLQSYTYYVTTYYTTYINSKCGFLQLQNCKKSKRRARVSSRTGYRYIKVPNWPGAQCT